MSDGPGKDVAMPGLAGVQSIAGHASRSMSMTSAVDDELACQMVERDCDPAQHRVAPYGCATGGACGQVARAERRCADVTHLADYVSATPAKTG